MHEVGPRPAGRSHRPDHPPAFAESTPVNALNKDAEALLWHQRLIHSGTHAHKDLHEHVDGVPNLSDFKLYCFLV